MTMMKSTSLNRNQSLILTMWTLSDDVDEDEDEVLLR